MDGQIARGEEASTTPPDAVDGLTLLGAINTRQEDRTAHIAMDSNGIVTLWHPDAEALFGWTAEEAIGQLLKTLIIPDALHAMHEAGLRRWQASGVSQVVCKHLSTVAVHKNGMPLPVLVDVAIIVTPDGIRVLAWVQADPEGQV